MTGHDPISEAAGTDAAAGIARALLYEGFSLYPYRPSALKNQQRYFFGGVYPAAWSAKQEGVDPDHLSVQCLADADSPTKLSITLRFLQLLADDVTERSITVGPFALSELESAPLAHRFEFGEDDGTTGITGELCCSIRRAADGNIWFVHCSVYNRSTFPGTERDAVLLRTLASAHMLLELDGEGWVSLLEPPEQHTELATSCEQEGMYPVLLGRQGSRRHLLASPILLYDYPSVAPESATDLFDATEIDEILTLRIQTLTAEEKQEIAAANPKIAALLERVDSLSPEEMQRLHGAFRPAGSSRIAKAPGAPKVGDRVRLHPKPGADVMDLALDGRAATVIGVEQDFDGGTHVSVVLDDDPGADLGRDGFHGHRFFFSTDEVEPL